MCIVSDLNQCILFLGQDVLDDSGRFFDLVVLVLWARVATRPRRAFLLAVCVVCSALRGVCRANPELSSLVSQVTLAFLDHKHLPVGLLFESSTRVRQILADLLDCRDELSHATDRDIGLVLD